MGTNPNQQWGSVRSAVKKLGIRKKPLHSPGGHVCLPAHPGEMAEWLKAQLC
jgi:hypothetical protein